MAAKPAQHVSTQNASVQPKSNSSSIIKGVCDDSLLKGTCNNAQCDLLHLTEPIRSADAHFHDRLLKENWSSAIESVKNVEHFFGITNIHKSSMWNDTVSIVPEPLQSKVGLFAVVISRAREMCTEVQLYESYGIHPRYLGDDPHNDLLRLRDLIQTRPLVAVGECGLDLLNKEELSMQTEIFSSQIKLANEFHLPLIIHCRQLDQQLLDILKQCALDASTKIQWHCCHSKGAATYQEFLRYFPSSILSIGGMCCHSGEKNLQKLLRELHQCETDEQQRRFVFETDAPYLKSSSLLVPGEENCPILGTLAASAYVTKNVLKNNQWTNNLKVNTSIL